MAINKKLVNFKKKVHYTREVNAGLPNHSISFIEETGEIITHGRTYGGTYNPFTTVLTQGGNSVTLVDIVPTALSNYLPLAGGQMTGDITFKFTPTTSPQTNKPGTAPGLSWSGSSDGCRIYWTCPTGDDGTLWINSTDDASEKIHFAWNGSERYVFQSQAFTIGTSLFNTNGQLYGALNASNDISTDTHFKATGDDKGALESALSTGTYAKGFAGRALINSTAGEGYNTLIRAKSTNGVFALSTYNKAIQLFYAQDSNLSTSGYNSYTYGISLLNQKGVTTLRQLRVANDNISNDDTDELTYPLTVNGTAHISSALYVAADSNGQAAVIGGLNVQIGDETHTPTFKSYSTLLLRNESLNGQLQLWRTQASQRAMIGFYNGTTQTYLGSLGISQDSKPIWETSSTIYKIAYAANGTTALGSATQPIYLDANGQLQTCTSYANATVSTADHIKVTDHNTDNSVYYPTWVTNSGNSMSVYVSKTYLKYLPKDGLLTTNQLHVTSTSTFDSTVTVKGSIQHQTTNYTSTPILVEDDGTTYGHTLIVEAGGTTYVGGGDAASSLRNNLGVTSTENLYLGADQDIHMYVNCQAIASKIDALSLTTDGYVKSRHLIPKESNTYTLGSLTSYWNAAYLRAIYVGNDAAGPNAIHFCGVTSDAGAGHTFIAERLYGSSNETAAGTADFSELVLFKGNDSGTTTSTTASGSSVGPDRIRHIAGAHRFQVYTSALSGDVETVCRNANLVTKLDIAQVQTTSYNNTVIGTSSATRTLTIYGSTQTRAITPETNVTYSIGTTTNEYAHTYTRTLNARHLDASCPYSNDKNLYIGYGDEGTTAATYFYTSLPTDNGVSRGLKAQVNGYGFKVETYLGVNGQNTSYNLYVNGTSNFVSTATFNAGVTVGNSTANANFTVNGNSIQTGYLYKAFTKSNDEPMIWMNGGDFDNKLFTISSGTSTNQYYGYSLKYIGTGSDAANYLDMIADNMNQTDVTAWSLRNDGKMGIGGRPSTDYQLKVSGSIHATSWIRTDGSTGWYSQTYGGGWYMSDTTWIRAYNDKSIYTGGTIKGYTLETTTTGIDSNSNIYGALKTNLTTSTYLEGNKGRAIINSTAAAGYNMLFRMKSTNGVFTGGVYNANLEYHYTTDSVITANSNSVSYTLKLLDESGNTTLPGRLFISSNNDVTTGLTSGALVIGNTSTATIGIDDNEIMARNSKGATTLYLNGDGGGIYVGGTIANNGNIETSAGLFKSTANGNTVTIGSQNSSWCHIYNSADIPFIFNRSVVTQANMYPYQDNASTCGTSSNRWSGVYTKALNVDGDISLNDTGSITHLKLGGGIYWNPYAESATDNSDAASIVVSTSGGATTMTITQNNDAADTINFVVNSNTGVKIKSNTVWHAGNDGADSGLDADLLDGLHLGPVANTTANRVVRTDSSGYIQSGWIYTTSGGFNTKGTVNGVANLPTNLVRIYCSEDSYIRYLTPSDFLTTVGLGLYEKKVTLKPTTDWLDTGIKSNAIGGAGSYLVQITLPSSSGSDGWGDIYTGYCTIFDGTNSTYEDEIPLHCGTHALIRRIYLKTQATANSDGRTHFYIASESNFAANREFTFKFRKLI